MTDEMSLWEKHSLEDKVTAILAGVSDQRHHCGGYDLSMFRLSSGA